MADQGAKLTEGLMRSLNQMGEQDCISIIVRYAPTRRVMRHRELMRGVREGYHYRLRPFVQMEATPEAIRRLEADDEVVRIYEDRPVRAWLDTSVARIGVPRLWGEGLTGANVRIAILDTGIDMQHPDLQGRIGAVTDFTGEGPEDGNGHGTHCAGVAAGSGAASGGRYRGVAPGAILYSAKVLRSDGRGMMSDVMAGVEWAVAQNVQIFSLSLGAEGPCDGTDALSEMCDAAVEAGVIACVAAGNEGPGNYTIGSPGCARQVITVGACDDADRVASFSSRGPTSDGRVKPDILGPGVNIVSARAHGTSMGQIVDAHYTSASGTSMATPHIAGLCALLLEAQPELTPQQIKQRLLGTAVDLGLSPYIQGRGRVDGWRAFTEEVQPGPEPTPPLPPPGPAPGQGCLVAMLEMLLLGRRK
ncbi:MAG: S8 family peptidase [Chloroflexi bacterium]|nr:S8 family peptidase [Chloroflexota bacterium]